MEHARIEAVVPSEPGLDLKRAFESWERSEDDALLPFVPQRSFLLFDERIPIYVVLRIPVEEADLQSCLARLAVAVEAFAVNAAADAETGEAPGTTKELLFSETVPDVDPSDVHLGSTEAHTYLAWRRDVVICRPRGRISKPAIYFSPTASLRASLKADATEYLPSNVPVPGNLLQSFESDPVLRDVRPRLSALRTRKMAAVSTNELWQHVKPARRRLFRVAPAFVWRLRYTKTHSPLSTSAFLASLDIEISHFAGCAIDIASVHLSLQNGSVECYSTADRGTHAPGDQVTYVYRLVPNERTDRHPQKACVLDLSIKAEARVSATCPASIASAWRTPVDFGQMAPSGRERKSDSLALAEESVHPQGLESPIHVALTISGPPRVQVGRVFQWNVFLVNRSDKARKLAVVVIAKRTRHADHFRAGSSHVQHPEGDAVASAVLEENVLYAKQKSARMEPAKLVCLTTDVRIGHLHPGACSTAELKFLALSSGALNVDALRVVDAATQEATDIRDVPGIVAVDALDA